MVLIAMNSQDTRNWGQVHMAIDLSVLSKLTEAVDAVRGRRRRRSFPD